MASDYTSLKASIQSWSERSYSDDQLDEFIDNAEATIRRELTGYQREITATWTMDSDGEYPLPSDFIGIRSVYYNDEAYHWNISGSTLTVIDGESYAMQVTYFGILDALSASNTTNWLIDAAPDVYLLLCQAQQRAYEEEYQTAAGLEASGLAKLDRLNLQNTVAQYGRTTLRMRVAP